MIKEAGNLMHATALDVSGKGIVITGKSGAGKSNLALNLISLGAGLISDDQTLFKPNGDKIFLTKPKPVPEVIEARGLGLIPVPTVSGCELSCFVELTNEKPDRLPEANYKVFLGRMVRLIHFNVSHGNISALFLALKHGLLPLNP